MDKIFIIAWSMIIWEYMRKYLIKYQNIVPYTSCRWLNWKYILIHHGNGTKLKRQKEYIIICVQSIPFITVLALTRSAWKKEISVLLLSCHGIQDIILTLYPTLITTKFIWLRSCQESINHIVCVSIPKYAYRCNRIYSKVRT